MPNDTATDRPRRERVARCGHTYTGSATGAVKRLCHPGCTVDVPRLPLPGRPTVGPTVHMVVYLDLDVSGKLTAMAGAGRARSRVIAGIVADALSGPVDADWGRWTVQGGYRPEVRTDVYVDPVTAGRVGVLAAGLAAVGVPSARSAVLRAVLAAGVSG